ncbi:hypothetical protein THF1C08_900002 [Vibrio jasicida]|nr:hypothetical protein THF1C08_900002 [Vibrio jasicida]
MGFARSLTTITCTKSKLLAQQMLGVFIYAHKLIKDEKSFKATV